MWQKPFQKRKLSKSSANLNLYFFQPRNIFGAFSRALKNLRNFFEKRPNKTQRQNFIKIEKTLKYFVIIRKGTLMHASIVLMKDL